MEWRGTSLFPPSCYYECDRAGALWPVNDGPVKKAALICFADTGGNSSPTKGGHSQSMTHEKESLFLMVESSAYWWGDTNDFEEIPSIFQGPLMQGCEELIRFQRAPADVCLSHPHYQLGSCQSELPATCSSELNSLSLVFLIFPRLFIQPISESFSSWEYVNINSKSHRPQWCMEQAVCRSCLFQ